MPSGNLSLSYQRSTLATEKLTLPPSLLGILIIIILSLSLSTMSCISLAVYYNRRTVGVHITVNGKECINLATFNFLGFLGNTAIKVQCIVV